jgi:hypothetical protein
MKTISDFMRDKLRGWLSFVPAAPSSITIQETTGFYGRTIENLIWYRGSADELHQFYTQAAIGYVGRNRFWAAAPAKQQIRKIHSGLPALIVNILSSLAVTDMDEVDFDTDAGKEDWQVLCKSINFTEKVKQAIALALVAGDGAFRISIDTEVSKYPILSFFSGENVEFITRQGYVTGVAFWIDKHKGQKLYRLKEIHIKTEKGGSVSYELYLSEKKVPLSELEDTSGLESVEYKGDFNLAIPLKFYPSVRFPERGKSIFNLKTDSFDALDEIISQWMDAVRSGRVRAYIPRDMLPTDSKTLRPLQLPSFGCEYVITDDRASETGTTDKIDVVQPNISYDAYLQSYVSFLDLCLQGIVSPATLGIDVGKMASAQAQREKKDITGVTRNQITSVLEDVLPQLVKAILMAYDAMQGKAPGVYLPAVSFGEYGAPDFDSRVDTIGRVASTGIMSTEAFVDELWGASKDSAWKAAEVARLKAEQGAATLETDTGALP